MAKVVIFLAVTATTGGCVNGSDNKASTGDSETSTPLVYYVTDPMESTGELGLVRGGRIIAHRTGKFSSINRPVWTADGRYVVALDESAARGQLVVIDGQTGAVRTISCSACTTLAAVGGSRLLVGLDPVSASASGDTSATDRNEFSQYMSVLQVDLSSPETPTQVTTKLPKKSGLVEFLAGAPNGVLISTASSVGQPDRLALLKSDGSVVPLGSSDSSIPLVPVAATVGTANGRTMFALNGGWQKFVPNEQGGHIFLLDATTGKHTYTDISAIAPPDQLPSSEIQINVFDLWWDRVGTLYATIALYTGSPHATPPFAYKISPRLWRLNGNRWMEVSPDRVLGVRQIDDHTRAVIVPLKDGDGDGELYVDIDGKRTRLADHVSYISTPQ